MSQQVSPAAPVLKIGQGRRGQVPGSPWGAAALSRGGGWRWGPGEGCIWGLWTGSWQDCWGLDMECEEGEGDGAVLR